ncbi:phosphatidate cytidylyltransferase [Clostridium amazonitimonense]|uniref:phosphatidate cytidylyltransferase n=1 Tax=Clostridium amazonitimonense TaxID=1499689 RepID=UPI0005098CC4|nr:phosphatidate cytidylyltransferase [Clostridium amazonitimonense]
MKPNSRYLGALILSPLVIFLFIGGIYLKFISLALSLMGMYEIYKAAKEINLKPIPLIGYLACLTYYIFNSNMSISLLIVIALTFILLIIPVINTEYNFIDISVTILGFIYSGVFFSFISLVNEMPYGKYLVWIIFLSSWICDTTAYYAGRFFGKRKLCPKVSPKKTIEGSIGGLVGSMIACGVYGFFISKNVPIAIHHYIILGLLCGIFGQFGDLAASSIKRYVGIKDYSNLIPGHGGILDRFDSVVFSSVVVFYYFHFLL